MLSEGQKMGSKYKTTVFIRLLKTSTVLLMLVALNGCKEQNIANVTYDVDSNNESFGFIWKAPDTPYLRDFRQECRLDEIVAGCKTDSEKVEKLCRWTHELWKHNGGNTPAKSDPLSIVKEAGLGKNFRCVEYAKVLSASLNSIGIPARIIGLKTKDVETRRSGAGHVAVEAYISSLSKWIFIDPQWNAIPYSGKTPLNAVELAFELLQEKQNIKMHSNSIATSLFYPGWISKYLYFFDTRVDNRLMVPGRDKTILMLVPLGVENPEVFQIHSPMKNYVYTNSVRPFYPEPK